MRHKKTIMLQLKLTPHLTKGELKKKLTEQVEIRSFKRWQILYSVACNQGKKSEDLSNVLGISKAIIQRIVKRYNEYGADFEQKIKWGGRRDATSFLSIEEEQKMLNEFANKAAIGKILTAKDIRKEIKKKSIR